MFLIKNSCRALSIVLTGFACLLVPDVSSGETERGLPPVECVETLRKARIDASRGEGQESLERLEAAIDLPGCNLPALAELLRGLEGVDVAPGRLATYRSRLLALVADPATELPPGMISFIAWSTPSTERQPLVEALENRRSGRGVNSAPNGSERKEVLNVLTALYDLLGETERARKTLAQLIEIAPTTANRWRALLLDERLERWESALELLETMIEGNQPPEYLLRLRVLALAHLGRYDEMLVVLDQLAPRRSAGSGGAAATDRESSGDRFASLMVRAAWALRDAGRDREAESVFQRAIDYSPQAAEIRSAELALLHLYSNAEERANHQAALDQRRREETDPVALYEEASGLLASRNDEAAREMLARAAPQLGDTAFAEAAWYNLGIAAFRLERWQQAADAFAQAIRLEPTRPEAHRQRGVALYQLGQCKGAIPSLLESLRLQPEKQQIHYYLAACYDTLGDRDAANRSRELYEAGGS